MKFVIVVSFVLGSCGLCVSKTSEKSSPWVITPLGPIEGLYNISNGGRLYEVYKGIPYAQPPTGESRFRVRVQPHPDTLVYASEQAARSQAPAVQSPVRFYDFSYRGAHSFSESLSGTSENFGVSHGDDLRYVLDSFFDPTTTVEDREMQKVLINLWVSFATNGTPDVGVKWPRLSKSQTEEFRYLHIAGPGEIGMKSSSNFGEKNFWRSIGFQENIL